MTITQDQHRWLLALIESWVGPSDSATEVHGWRCHHPDRFPGFCTCADDITGEIESLIDGWETSDD